MALCILVWACGGCARRLDTSTTQSTEHRSTQRDSSATERNYSEKVRLTPVEAGADAVDFETQLEVLPTGQLKPATYTSRGRRATVNLKVDAQGKVTGKCGCDAEKAMIASLDRQLTEKQKQVQQKVTTHYRTRTITNTVRVPYTAWYDWLARFVAIGLLLLLLIMYLIHRFSPKQNE
jgi:hypothetical protein